MVAPARLLLHRSPSAEETALYDRVASHEDYYPRRCELRLLDAHLPTIARDVGVAARVIEPGGSVDIKTKRLLRALDRPAMYIGIDLARDALEYGAKALRAEHPDLDVHAMIADFTQPLALPTVRRTIGKTLVYFSGATIGTFEPHDAVMFLGRLQRMVGPNSRLLLGADGTRDPEALVAAYESDEGRYRVRWNEMRSRVEMQFDDKTEFSYKHSPHAMRGMLHAAGWQVRQVFTASEQPMRLWLCEPKTA